MSGSIRNTVAGAVAACVVLGLIVCPPPGYCSDFLLKASLGGGSVGVASTVLLYGVVGGPSLGVQITSSEHARILLSSKLWEFLPSGYGNDYLFTGSVFPLYLCITSDFHSEARMPRAFNYFYVGGSGWSSPYGMYYLRCGYATRRTFWAIGVGSEVSLAVVRSPSGDWGPMLVCSISAFLDLGGWWAIRTE